MEEREEIIGKILTLIANIACESTSVMCFYEPEIPKKIYELKDKQRRKYA